MLGMRKGRTIATAFLGLLVIAFCASCRDQPPVSTDFELKESVIAGGPDHFMEVRHVLIRGKNFEIGRAIGQIARENGVTINPSNETALNGDKRRYMATHYPAFYERMRGVATAFGLDFEDERYSLSGLPQNTRRSVHCSAVFFPPQNTHIGHGLVSRNYDYSTGNLENRRPAKGELPVMSHPYIFELYPDQGYASIAITAFDYLGGTLDGINVHGLTVVVLADGESRYLHGLHPTNEVGLHELLVMRYLLDNCKDVTEAKEALQSLHHYYSFMPCHYLVADGHGDAFIFEISPDRKSKHITEAEEPLCVTNHLVYRHPDVNQLPPMDTFDRYKLLHKATRKKDRFTKEEIVDIHALVAFPPFGSTSPVNAPYRTLWYSLYDTKERSLMAKFYLGESSVTSREDEIRVEYSDFIVLSVAQ
jgi:predicted choloylglycine hydrolase